MRRGDAWEHRLTLLRAESLAAREQSMVLRSSAAAGRADCAKAQDASRALRHAVGRRKAVRVGEPSPFDPPGRSP
jgi:hypothetical protein